MISGGAGFGASVAAGALLGSAIPVPIFGTLFGAAGGVAVGIFTSGAVDNLFTGSGPGEAFDAGIDAVADAGSSLLDGTRSVWNSLF